jgi:hypothetical protein
MASKTVVSRADGDLGRYEEGIALAADVLAAAETAGNDDLIATALENRAVQLRALGRLPEALVDRERLESIHTRHVDRAKLPFDLTNRAGLLIELGRPKDALNALGEVDRDIANGIESYVQFGPRVQMLRVLEKSVAQRYVEIAEARWGVIAKDDTALYAMVLSEHARAMLGRSSAPTSVIAAWLDQASSTSLKRDLAYWIAHTLLARGDRSRAEAVAVGTLSTQGGLKNIELRWRLEALATRLGLADPQGASMAAQAKVDFQRLRDSWGAAAAAYLARPDIVELSSVLH